LIGGAFWNEGLMRIVPWARERLLKRDGRLAPWRVDVLGVPCRHLSPLERSLRFWSRRHYGFDFGRFGPLAFRQQLAEARHPFGIELRGEAAFLARPGRRCALRLCREWYRLRVPRRKTSGRLGVRRAMERRRAWRGEAGDA
jgi:hypothetical protein